MALTDEQKKKLKEQRLLIYDSRLFELEMDLTAARAYGDLDAIPGIEAEMEKLRRAREAIENM